MAGLAAGGGAIAGTGAFSQIGAQRSVTVETAGDAGANLGIEPFEDSPNDNYVNAPDNGTVEINVDSANENAITSIDRLLQVTNNGSQEIYVGFDNQYGIDPPANKTQIINNLPAGWGYAVNEDESAVIVVWASPLEKNMNNTYQEVRPDLVTTGFGSTSTLVNGNTIRGEVNNRSERKIGSGEQVHIGAVIDTRNSTIGTINQYTSNAEPPYSEITFSAERTN
jgi:hypothetical protein